MFLHRHPYAPFIPKDCTRLIIGTIPPPRFSQGKLFDEDVNWCYGSKYGLLWPLLDRLHDLNLSYENSNKAIEQRKLFLKRNKIGICDMVDHCLRDKIDASDLGMRNIHVRDLMAVLRNNKGIHTILFMGGNSKNGPEHLFRKHVRQKGMFLEVVSGLSPRHNRLYLDNRYIETYSLISPSSAANRSIGGHPDYKIRKSLNPSYSTFDFRIEQYQKFLG